MNASVDPARPTTTPPTANLLPAGRGGRGGRSGRDLTTGPIARTLLAFALPTLGSSVLQSLNGSINAVWIGRFLGEDALAATSNANLVLFLLSAGIFGFGMAATILVGQAIGRHDLDAARRAIGTATGTFAFLSALLAVVGWFATPAILAALGTPGQAAALAEAYLRVIFVSMPASFMLVLAMMGLRGAGDSVTPLKFMALSVVLDAALNPVLILGLGGLPRMGIAGSATATVIANYASLAALLAYVYARDLPLRLRGPEFAYLRPQGALLRTILGKGLPMGLQMMVVSGAALAMMGLVNQHGVDTTAAYGVASQLWTYIQMPAMAIGAAVSAMAAQNIGAGRWDRVIAATRAGVAFNLLLTGGLIAAVTLADRAVLGLFLPGDSPAVPLAQRINLIVGWGFLLFGVTIVLFGTIRAKGAVIAPLVILAISMFPVRLGLARGLEPWLGVDALWWSFPIASAASMTMALLYWRFGGWRGARMAVPAAADPQECERAALTPAEHPALGDTHART